MRMCPSKHHSVLLLLLFLHSTAVAQQLLWSDPSTWPGGQLPALGDNVTIAAGEHVLLDTSPPQLDIVTLEAGSVLEFQDLNGLLLQVSQLDVKDTASLIVGSPSTPLANDVTIRLVGTRANNNAKAIFVHGNGHLDFYGTPRSPTFTKLAATALENDGSIAIQGSVDWQVNEHIAIASSDFELDHAESRTIAGISHDSVNDVTTLTLDSPLNHDHYGERQCWNDAVGPEVCVDEIAEVILLSRNLVIEGDSNSHADDGYGGHVRCALHGGGQGGRCRFSYTEFRQMGQRHVLGAYPIHFHLAGLLSGSLATGNALWDCFNKAIVIHGTHGTLVDSNVAYEIEGHSIYFEDGTEKNNTISNNVVMNTRVGSITNEEKKFPASYWVSNPQNTLTDNIAAGSEYAGFWFFFENHLPEEVDPDDVECPRYRPLTEFRGNEAHSNFKYGLEVNPTWIPKSEPCDRNSDDAQAVLLDFFVWKNGYDGISFRSGEIGAVLLKNVVASNNAKFYQTSANLFYHRLSDKADNGTIGVEDAVLVHLSANNPFRRNPINQIRRGVHLAPKTDNFFIKGVTFINYDEEGTAIVPYRFGSPSKTGDIGFEIRTQGLRFINSVNRVQFLFAHHGILVDLDGTLTGSGTPSRIVADAPIYDLSSECALQANRTIATYPPPGEEPDDIYHSAPLLACDVDYPIRRVGEGRIKGSGVTGMVWADTAAGTSEVVAVYGSSTKKFVFDAPTNRAIEVTIVGSSDPTLWEVPIGTRYMGPNEHLIFRLVFLTDVGSTLSVELDGDPVPLASSQQDIDNCQANGYLYDAGTTTLHICLIGHDPDQLVKELTVET